MSPDDKTPPRPQWARPRPPQPPGAPPPPPPRPVADPAEAEKRMRDEMARQRRQEEAHLKSLKFGCIGVIVALVLAMVIAFLI